MAGTNPDSMSPCETLAHWIANFPFDIKILLDIAGDKHLDIPKRALAIGVLSYILTPIDVLPDKLRSLGLVDDVMMLRLALATIWDEKSDRYNLYMKMHPGVMSTLDQDAAFLEKTLGTAYDGIHQLTLRQINRTYRQSTPEQVIYSDDLIDQIFNDATQFAARLRSDSSLALRTLARFSPPEIARLLETGLREEARREKRLERISITKREHLR